MDAPIRESDLLILRRKDRGSAQTQTAPVKVRVVKRKHLGNPVVELWQEVSNDRATWIDAAFWFVVGVLSNVLGDALWELIRH